MKKLRKILFPFSILYGGITSVRNKLFDVGVLKSTSFDFPTIVVGNLSVGGTGKTPQIEYLIRLLKDSYQTAVLSRGYKRSTEGFIMADATVNAEMIGDEPYQYFRKFQNITVAVDANRVHGIQEIKKQKPETEIVLLDDAFQHRKLDAGFYILLTSYDSLYSEDLMLPAGNLREYKSGVKRAKAIIVTKCPENLSLEEQKKIQKKLKLDSNQELFFSKISYDETLISHEKTKELSDILDYEIVLVTGIAKPKPLVSFLEQKGVKLHHIEFPDHHHFTEQDILKIKDKYHEIPTEKKLILTTEKDYVRIFVKLDAVYYIPIKTTFFSREDIFNKLILDYVGESTGNS
ncbi:tetraacyldisaccharide 4'-kinase [Aureivirga marina]|uniref:tetraacyldisaccharide 4'-kinase n=1 Tax=Aureivirga marina TaxID=1182451 RepID=UPI0018CAAB11|nr:tetraacyldisaccharide 4'-kinase [Aureivirga marina]